MYGELNQILVLCLYKISMANREMLLIFEWVPIKSMV